MASRTQRTDSEGARKPIVFIAVTAVIGGRWVSAVGGRGDTLPLTGHHPPPPPTDTIRWSNVELMLDQRRRRWTGINPTLMNSDERHCFLGIEYSHCKPEIADPMLFFVEQGSQTVDPTPIQGVFLVLAFSGLFEYPCYRSTTIINNLFYNSFSAGIVFIRQILTSTDVRIWRIKTVPALKGLP